MEPRELRAVRSGRSAAAVTIRDSKPGTQEKRLAEILRRLPAEHRILLVEFAEFLASRAGPPAEVVPEPTPIPRPDEESVVKAIKRLMATYHMLDRGKLLHETAHYMTQHVVHGRPAVEVIEELEKMFDGHYRSLKDRAGRKG